MPTTVIPEAHEASVSRRVHQKNAAQEVTYRLDSAHDYVVTRVESITSGNVFGGNYIVTALKYGDFEGYWLPNGWLVEVKSNDVLVESHEIAVVEYSINPTVGDDVFQIGDLDRLLYPGALVSQHGVLKEVASDGSIVPLGTMDRLTSTPQKPKTWLIGIVVVIANAVAVAICCMLYFSSKARQRGISK